jgi:hypothetical protein
MAKRNPFVPPDVVRLNLVDVHIRAKQQLLDKGKPLVVDGKTVDGKWVPATPEDLEAVTAAIAQAEEDGWWLDVKAELNTKETRHIFSDLVKNFRVGEQATLDPDKVGFTKIVQWIVNWNLPDAQGNRVPFSEAALGNLYPEIYQEVSAAIDWHEEEVEKKKAERKNARTTANTSATI